MTDRPSASDWPHWDRRWLDVTYLGYLEANPREQFERSLQLVTWSTLAAAQPKEYADFAGCNMRWNLDRLDLDEHRRRDLLLGMASNGVRVPGTGFVFRVARPWYALFEERLGDFPALPNDWMEVVHVRKSGFSGRYEWIGRRQKRAEWVVRWSLYDETPSGWQLKPRPLTQLSENRLRTEIDRVLAEIDEFQNLLIPEMVERDPPIFLREPVSKSPRWTDKLRLQGEWRRLVGSLRAILAAELSALPRSFDFEVFRPATWVEPTIDYSVEPDRIRWQICCFGSLDWADLVNWTVLPDECRPRNPDDVAGRLEAIKRWMTNGSPHNMILWDALVGVLPMIADREPEFAWKLLDMDDWSRRAQGVRFASDVQRQFSEVERNLRHVVNNALVHVISALANNNFREIRAYLDNPAFLGQSTSLVPRNLLAVLCAKVYVLQQLCPNTSIFGRRSAGWSLG